MMTVFYTFEKGLWFKLFDLKDESANRTVTLILQKGGTPRVSKVVITLGFYIVIFSFLLFKSRF